MPSLSNVTILVEISGDFEGSTPEEIADIVRDAVKGSTQLKQINYRTGDPSVECSVDDDDFVDDDDEEDLEEDGYNEEYEDDEIDENPDKDDTDAI